MALSEVKPLIIYAQFPDALCAARSPLTQCFTIHGCLCTSSNGILFSGSRTSNCEGLAYLSHSHFRCSKHTLLIRSFASGLTNPGTVISPLAILLCVIIGVSSNGASPTRNSYVRTPKLHKST